MQSNPPSSSEPTPSSLSKLQRLPRRMVHGAFSRSGLACVVGGAAFVLAHPPVSWWPLVFVALVPLVVVARRCGRPAGFGYGYLFGLVVEGGGTYWIGPTVGDFYRVYMSSGEGATLYGWTIGAAAFLAWWLAASLLWGLWGWALTFVRGRGTLAFGWVVLSLVTLDALFPRVFPWNVGSALVAFPTLAQPCYWFGTSVLTLGVAVIGVLLSFGFELGREHGPRRAQRCVLASVLLLAVWSITGEWRLASADSGQALRIGYVQPNIALEFKHDVANQQAVFDDLLAMSRDLVAAEPCQLVVWPEGMFDLTIIPGDLRPFVDLGVPVVVGGGYPLGQGAGNFAFAIDVAEQPPVVGYAKRYLLVFGERFPFSGLLESIGIPVPGGLTPGERTVTFEVGDPAVRCGLSVCFEGILGATGDDLVHDRVQLHVNITEDLWYGRTSAPYQHLALVALRALESGIPVVRVTNGGVSAWIDSHGHIRDRVPLETRASGVFQVEARSGRPVRPWTRSLGDALPFCAPVVLLVGAVLRRFRS